MTHERPPSKQTKADLERDLTLTHRIRAGLEDQLADARAVLTQARVPPGTLPQRLAMLVAENEALRQRVLHEPVSWTRWLAEWVCARIV